MFVEKNKEILKLKKITKDFNNNKIKIIQKEGNVFSSQYYFFYYFLKLKTNIVFRNILVDAMEKSEINFPGSSLLLCKKIVKNYFKKNLKQKKINKKKSLLKDLKFYIENNFDKKTTEIFFNILELGGPDVSIKTIPSLNNNIEVLFSNISEFNLEIDENLANYLFKNNKQITNKKFNILLSDTFIEKDSEVYKCIEIEKKNKSRLVLVSRGYSKDFYRNIKEIMLKNNILIYPYVCKFNDKDPFKISDLGEALSINIVSPDRGENINSFCEDYIKEFNNIVLSKNKIEIKKINNISKKLKKSLEIETKDEKLKEYLQLRKKRLISKKCNISIPQKNHKLIREINIIIKTYNEICKHGMTKNNVPYKLDYVTEELARVVINQIKNVKVIIKDEN